MNEENSYDEAAGEQCKWCGALIEFGAGGRVVREREDKVAYVCKNCPDCA